ncbi:MAG: alanine dehydrogenase [Actinomycetota bacterium]|jgi:ornithine cyclodeaminase/alanine dehydrogenase-like protein (mu-crystallin family)|nr:alanine dehydrogenase [Actinomycetota bacterium]
MLILNRAEVEELLDLDVLIDALAPAFVELSAGRASVPPRVAALAPDGFLGVMPGYVEGTLAVKLVNVFNANHAKGLPSHQAVIALFDSSDGTPLAIMDGTAITAVRTACTSALATRELARKGARTLAVIGAGVQGRAHLQAIPRVRDFGEIRVSSRSRDHAVSLASEFDAVASDDFESAVRGADVVCLCTDATTPVIDRRWLSSGAHVTSVGASFGGGELDEATVRDGLLVVESRVAFEPPPAGAFELQGHDPASAAELGEILSGAHPGRTSDEAITVYKSMGHAVEDATAARLVYDAATRAGRGLSVDL